MFTTLLKPYHWIHKKIDQTGMYRVVTLGLAFLTVYSLLLSLLGVGAYSFFEQLLSLAVVVSVCGLLNLIFAEVVNIPANHESALITALILFFLFTPAFSFDDHQYIALAAVVAIASKFILVWRRQHIFNAAAIGTVALSLSGWHEAWWWVASPEMFIPLLLVGLVVTHKIRKWAMVGACAFAALAVFGAEALLAGSLSLAAAERFFVTGPLLFLAFFMLTEPFTTPPRQSLQMMYGALVGALMSTTLLSGFVAMTPELALIIGNITFYSTLLGQKLYLHFIERKEVGSNTYEYIFQKPAGMRYEAGQYLEWMLPHASADTRGLRRYFTIASGPEDADVRVALREMPESGSSYKQALATLAPGDHLIASQLAGDFTLPKNQSEKCGFIAGGIGVTPFVSFTRHLIATKSQRDCALLYCNNQAKDIAYKNLFTEAETQTGLNTVHVLSRESLPGYEHGYISAEIIKRNTPDYLERTWYISGPPAMVNAAKAILTSELNVSRNKIITDFFPGLA